MNDWTADWQEWRDHVPWWAKPGAALALWSGMLFTRLASLWR